MKGDGGFTLMEVLVSLLILGGLLLTVVSSLNRRIDLVQRQREEVTAALLAREKLSAVTMPDGKQEGTFAPQEPSYRWRIERFPSEFPGISRIVMTVSWGEDRRYTLVTYAAN
ncbi:MAG: hypothetical protein Fur0034_17200 [Desulfuromonadia bacterium]